MYVAAVVDQDARNQFYLNECIDSKENYVRIREGSSGNTKTGLTVQDGITRGPEEPSDNSIRRTAENSKENPSSKPGNAFLEVQKSKKEEASSNVASIPPATPVTDNHPSASFPSA